MNIPQEIDDIIEKRKKRLPIVKAVQSRIEKVNDSVKKLELICKDASVGGG